MWREEGVRCPVSANGIRVITGAAVAAASPLDADAWGAPGISDSG